MTSYFYHLNIKSLQITTRLAFGISLALSSYSWAMWPTFHTPTWLDLSQADALTTQHCPPHHARIRDHYPIPAHFISPVKPTGWVWTYQNRSQQGQRDQHHQYNQYGQHKQQYCYDTTQPLIPNHIEIYHDSKFEKTGGHSGSLIIARYSAQHSSRPHPYPLSSRSLTHLSSHPLTHLSSYPLTHLSSRWQFRLKTPGEEGWYCVLSGNDIITCANDQ